MAWRVESLDDLKDFYRRMKDKNVPIDRVADHGVSLGIYFHDPDGNGIEVYYELPRAEWPRQEQIFAADMMNRGRFPGPMGRRADRPARRARSSKVYRHCRGSGNPGNPRGTCRRCPGPRFRGGDDPETGF